MLDARTHDYWLEQRLVLRGELARQNHSMYWLARRTGLSFQKVQDLLYGKRKGETYHWAIMARALGMKWTLSPLSEQDRVSR